MFTIYTKSNCSFCEQAKALLKSKSKNVNEIHVDEITREEFIKKFPTQKTLPLIFENDQKIGGYFELKHHLEFDF